MNGKWNRVASVLALVIGAMAVFAGGKVLIGIDPGYNVINWLPLYNYTAGLLTIVIAAPLLWLNPRWGSRVALVTLAAHAAVMALLQSMYRATVAAESIQAMTIRIVVWAVILGLAFLQDRSIRAGLQRSASYR